jgi:hypothetical protein
MRMQITIPPHLAERLRQLAVCEHRFPRQQAEILLWRAIELTDLPQETQQPQDAAMAVDGGDAMP